MKHYQKGTQITSLDEILSHKSVWIEDIQRCQSVAFIASMQFRVVAHMIRRGVIYTRVPIVK